MTKILIVLATAVTVTGAAFAAPSLALKDLPAAVRHAVQAETAGATIRAISTEKKDGATFYEVETTRNGRHRDLLFRADGVLSETEELLPPTEWPGPVAESMRKEGRIKSVERLTKGADITYEVIVVTPNGQQREIEVRADGALVNSK